MPLPSSSDFGHCYLHRVACTAITTTTRTATTRQAVSTVSYTIPSGTTNTYASAAGPFLATAVKMTGPKQTKQVGTMRFCPVCSYYLFLQEDAEGKQVSLLCRHCGYNSKLNPKTADEALVLETTFTNTGTKTGSALNEYTKLDPTLPHLKTIPCPNTACPSDPATRDILYIKTDAKNLKYQYCCAVCNTQWSS